MAKETMTLREVQQMLGVSRSCLWVIRTSDPTFPKPVPWLKARVLFRKEDVLRWFEGDRTKPSKNRGGSDE